MKAKGLKYFSNSDRKERLTRASAQSYDLIVIGGGITGAGIAMDAAQRGLAVLLLEKKDFASGTSSKSTKLIHGGLRYLKQLEFGLVRETGLERAVAHNNACHLVHPEKMLLPIVKNGTFSQLSANMAIQVYDMLANVEKGQRREKLSKYQIIEQEPLLREDILKSGIRYVEYRTDDARLTMEIVKAARRLGAESFNYLEVSGFVYDESGKISGVKGKDKMSSDEVVFHSKYVVSAAGPWVDLLRQKDSSASKTRLFLTKGIHIVLKREKLNIKHSTYFDDFDGRMIFAIPRADIVYVGTSDTKYDEDLDKVICTKDDAVYLVGTVNKMFNVDISIQDIQSTWAGLRPLVQEEGKGPTELSRKDEIFTSVSGLISIAGGKLTGFRKMAERIVDMVVSNMGLKSKACETKNFKIHHDPFHAYDDYLNYIDALAKEMQGEISAAYLVTTFGKDAARILQYAKDEKCSVLESMLYYTLQYEAVHHPLDFLDRRTGFLFFDIDRARSNMNMVIENMRKFYDYDEDWSQRVRQETQTEIDLHSLLSIKEIHQL